MDRQIIINMVEADTYPDLTLSFTGLVLSDYSTIQLELTKPDLTTKVVRTVTPSLTDDEEGTVTFLATDLVVGRSTADVYFAESGGGEFRLPKKYSLFFDVRADNA